MCGIVGIATAFGRTPSVDRRAMVGMRDRLAHRGPDDAGAWDGGNVLLGHRRLSVRDVSLAGRQPFVDPDSPYALVYNGELYNDHELRADLGSMGARFETTCDTETLFVALRAWGEGALPRLRGMFALAFLDGPGRRLTLARDPLGVKPLYYWLGVGGTELVFASELSAILAHPHFTARLDREVANSYLGTIRVTLGARTLLEGVRVLEPGEVRSFDLSREGLPSVSRFVRSRWTGGGVEDAESASEAARETIRESVERHLVADVPTCCLLSGGLDSAIVSTLAAGAGRAAGLMTYAAGAESGRDDDDLACARRMSEHLGTLHGEALVDGATFAARWGEMIAGTCQPLSTPNEVAIFEVARRLRRDGCVVTLSGEGADELLAGYDLILRAGLDAFPEGSRSIPALDLARALHGASAWVPAGARGEVLRDAGSPDADEGQLRHAAHVLSPGGAPIPREHAVRAMLTLLRRTNLEGLLLRLDSATMLAGVEGRTPLADAVVADLAGAIPTGLLFDPSREPGTKLVLRRAFAGVLPGWVVSRPKASFPLPFQRWLGEARAMAGLLSRSEWAAEVFHRGAIEEVSRRPGELWPLAWPMMNLAAWGERVWGAGRAVAERMDDVCAA